VDLPAQEARLLLRDHLPGQVPAALAHPVAPAAPGEAGNRKESKLFASFGLLVPNLFFLQI
jgi:hypothetical protein